MYNVTTKILTENAVLQKVLCNYNFPSYKDIQATGQQLMTTSRLSNLRIKIKGKMNNNDCHN